MHLQAKQLPSHFPIGTRYVVEGHRNGRRLEVRTRFLEFPDGRHVDLTVPSAERAHPRRRPAARRRARSRK
jgi:hypothetical protein